MNVQLSNIVPVSEARIRLNEMVNLTAPNRPYVILKSGKPKAVLVDVTEYEELMKIKASKQLGLFTNKARQDFTKYLKRRGIDLTKLTDQQAEKILVEEYLVE
jgi:prevent-host-death family protein